MIRTFLNYFLERGRQSHGRSIFDGCKTRLEHGTRLARMGRRPPSSGNRAFDDYRSETLKRLEEEQREFKDFLARLRFAKDRAEFDQFMAERRQRPFGPDSQAETPPAEPRN